MDNETKEQRAERIINSLKEKYPGKHVFSMNDDATHFVCELEPTTDHPSYDRAVEVLISTRPHKHLKMLQYLTIISGNLELHIDDQIF